MSRIPGLIHSIDPMRAVNNFGLRYYIYLQGCFRKCVYCSNPDTLNLYKNGKQVFINDLMKHIENKKAFFKPNNGGITVSGGEPLVQGLFVSELFKQTKSLGLTTCLNTGGMGRREYYKDILKNTDFINLSVKSLDPKRHHIISGKDISHMNLFINEIDNLKKETMIRHVLITNEKYKNIDEVDLLADFINKRKHCKGIKIIPYDDSCRFKWDVIAKRNTMNGVLNPTKAEIYFFIEELKKKLDKDKTIIL